MAVADRRVAVVTGGCGFVGVNVGRRLVERGWRAVAFDNLTTGSADEALAAGYDSVTEGDVRDADALGAACRSAEVVVHLAAHTNVVDSVADPRTDVDVNVTGTLNALLAARDAGCRRFVFASSGAPLGDAPPPVSEDVVLRPLSPYGASKAAGEALCSAFSGSYGLDTVVLRFSNVYGPFSHSKGSVVALWMRRALAGEPLVVYGDGDQTRDFVYVGDVAAAVVRALEAERAGGVFHIASGTEITVNALADELRRLFADRDLEVRHEPPRAGELARSCVDISKARAVLGYEPSMQLREGLVETHRWFTGVPA